MEILLSRSRVIAATAAALLTLPFSTKVGYAVFPNAPVARVPPPAIGVPITCNPTSLARPQPTLPTKFSELTLYGGCLTQPTAVSFSKNDANRVFVAEKGGVVRVCNLAPTPTCTPIADLSAKVCNADDRGLLGLAVDPTNDSKVYVLYTTPTAGCSGEVTTNGQLSLLTWDPANPATGSVETEILPSATATRETWCFYYTSHSIGGLAFGNDNTTLYVSAGEGASFNNVDYGQLGDGACGDGTNLPQGAFRSQGVSSYSDGVILQIATPSTPNPSAVVVANGFRNPFRFDRKPGTDDLYVGNVGWFSWESIDHVSILGQNFGWPCYEGWDPTTHLQAPELDYQNTGNCNRNFGNLTAPFFAYSHQGYVTVQDSRGKTCGGKPSGGGPDQNGSVISAIGFTDDISNTYPAAFKNALYFGDVLRKCIWTMQPPNNTPQTFAKGLQGGPVDLKANPWTGDLFYVDFVTSTVRRITHQ